MLIAQPKVHYTSTYNTLSIFYYYLKLFTYLFVFLTLESRDILMKNKNRNTTKISKTDINKINLNKMKLLLKDLNSGYIY